LKNTYRHPLDYAIGAKHYLTSEYVDVEFRVSSKNFYVEELVDLNKLGFNSSKGHYIVIQLEKRDVDTFTALRRISKVLNIPVENIIVLGLKDRNATSSQYVFIKRELVENPKALEDASCEKIRYKFLGFTLRKPEQRDLIGNRFRILIEDASTSVYEKMKSIAEKIIEYGLPSYYGYQRFGVKRVNTHLLGKYIVLGRVDLFVRELLHGIYPSEGWHSIAKRLSNKYSEDMFYEKLVYTARDIKHSISLVRSIVRDIYVDSYASYLYNLLLNHIIESHGWSALDQDYPMIGCAEYFDEYYSEIARSEGLTYNHIVFFKCWFRRGLFRPLDLKLDMKSSNIICSFVLERGFYASIVLREVFKENLVFEH